MSKKIIRLTESDLEKIVRRVINEQELISEQLKVGSKGNQVIDLQKMLIKFGADLGAMGADGKFGNRTKIAVQRYQQSKKLEPTGIVDQKLLGLMRMDMTNPFFKLPGQTSTTKTQTQTQTKTQPNKPGVQKSEPTSSQKNTAKCETGTDKVLDKNAYLLFDGDKLSWVASGQIIKSWDAESGLTWKNTPPKDWDQLLGRYTKSKEEWSKDKDAGPLPEGKYIVGPLETRTGDVSEIGALEAFWYKLTGQVEDETDANKQFCKNTILSRISWGNYRASITPIGGQNMYERGSFYVHGGSLAGSHGCIDLTDSMEDFAKFLGIWTSQTKNKKIPLTVKYKNSRLAQIAKKLTDLF